VYLGDKLPKRYIGSTFVENITNKNYNGSPSSVKYKSVYKQEQKNNRHLFKTRILQTYNTSKEALEAEEKLQIKYDVVKSDLYMNESFAKKNGYFGRRVYGQDHPSYGRKLSEDHRKAVSIGNTGNKSQYKGEKRSVHVRNKISKSVKKVMNTPEMKSHLSAKQSEWYANQPEEYLKEINDKRIESLNEFWSSEEGKKDIEKRSIANKGNRNPFYGKKHKTFVCPHCAKSGANGAMQRWHFDNCKMYSINNLNS
jgi:hypothetical protein